MKKINYTSVTLFLVVFAFNMLFSQRHTSSGYYALNHFSLSVASDTIPKKSVIQSADSSKNMITQDSLKNLLKAEIESRGKNKNLKPKIH